MAKGYTGNDKRDIAVENAMRLAKRTRVAKQPITLAEQIKAVDATISARNEATRIANDANKVAAEKPVFSGRSDNRDFIAYTGGH
jgi:hypothetical protein